MKQIHYIHELKDNGWYMTYDRHYHINPYIHSFSNKKRHPTKIFKFVKVQEIDRNFWNRTRNIYGSLEFSISSDELKVNFHSYNSYKSKRGINFKNMIKNGYLVFELSNEEIINHILMETI